MDHFVSFHRIRSRISNHGLVQFDALLIHRIGGLWLNAIFRGDNCVHPTVSGVTEVPIGMFTHLVDLLSSCRQRPDLDFNFHVPISRFSPASAIVGNRSISGAKAARLFMTASIEVVSIRDARKIYIMRRFIGGAVGAANAARYLGPSRQRPSGWPSRRGTNCLFPYGKVSLQGTASGGAQFFRGSKGRPPPPPLPALSYFVGAALAWVHAAFVV